METDQTAHTEPGHFKPRQLEIQAFAARLPLKGVEANSKRIFNVWGEIGVGKSTFLSEFRESELMLKSKVLWLQPTRDGKLDTIPEFIRACSKTVRYPAEPTKESKISERLDRVQQGKVNPVVSDDSILITRSDIARSRKPYINKAAAASVGRTEIIREDIEISVGLGESKANNQAEGFLDALPLQSLGTDLTVLYLENFGNLSVTIVDWLRDYVIPAATRGAYRRSVVVLLESNDPLGFAYPNENWGEWSHLTENFQVYPLSSDDTFQTCLHASIDPETARFIYRKTLGYPNALNTAIRDFKDGSFESITPEQSKLIESLSLADRCKLAGLCLPERLYPDELDAIFGPTLGASSVQWLISLPEIPLQTSSEGKRLSLPLPFRKAVVASVDASPDFKPIASKWVPLGKLTQNIAKRSLRSKLLLLAGLNWFDEPFCSRLFGKQAEKVFSFIVETPSAFNRNQERYRVTERFRDELRKTAESMQHLGVTGILNKANSIWEQRKTEIESRIQSIQTEIDLIAKELAPLERKHSESLAQIRIEERKHENDGEIHDHTPTKGGGFLSSLFPFLGNKNDSVEASLEGGHSAEALRKHSLDVLHHIQALEAKTDDLRAELDSQKKLLEFSFV